MTLTNPYRGVNAHLNSWLQQDDRWRDFADADHARLPLHIERYPAASQSRIQAVMRRVQASPS